MVACVEAFGYMMDGHEVQILEFIPEKDECVPVKWQHDPIFFATVKSEFTKQQQRMTQPKEPLRPEDV